MKMLLGFIFSLVLIGYTIYKKNKYWIQTIIVFSIGAIIFLGQFLSR